MSYNEIIPIELQDALIAIRDSDTRNAWAIGDITYLVIRHNAINQRPTELQEIYSAVGMFAGKASRTVREYHAIARFFAPELREQFSVLAFDHFRHAAMLGGERAILALQWAVDQVIEYGRPATVDMMFAKFALPQPGEPEIPEGNEAGPGGIYGNIFRSVSSQVMAAGNWLHSGEIDPGLEALIIDYQAAAQALVAGLPVMEGE